MKKFMILLVVVYSFAEEIYNIKNVINEVLGGLINKDKIKIFTLPKYYYYYFNNKKFILTKDCSKSDIIFGDIECANKPIFALDYKFYENHKNAFGVFYYRKGRPQLKLKKEELKKFFHKVPEKLKEFYIDF